MKKNNVWKIITVASLLVTLACIVLLARMATRNAVEARFWQDSYEGTITNR
jgi:hypothetical protein